MKNLKHILLMSFVLVLITQSSYAQSVRVKTTDLKHFQKVYQAAINPNQNHFTPARFTMHVAGFGRVKINLNRIKVSPVVAEIVTPHGIAYDTNPVVLLKGRAKTINGWERATAALAKHGKHLKLMTTFATRTRLSHKVNSITIEHHNVVDQNSPVKFQRTNAASLKNAHCASDALNSGFGVEQLAYPLSPTDNQPLFSPASAKELELSLYADNQYILSHGSSSQYILARVNDVEAIYEAQFGISLKVNRLRFDAGLDMNTSQAIAGIQNLQSELASDNVFSSADLFHLFTGRDLSVEDFTGVLGIAYLQAPSSSTKGVMCRFSNQYTVGITERLTQHSAGLINVIFAHEMGHNFSLEHVASGIMTASVSEPLPTTFSNESVSVLNSYVATHGACLQTGTPTPSPSATPTPTDTPGTGGGGGVGGPVPAPVDVELEATLDSNGDFSAEITLVEEPDNECVLKLAFGQKRRRLNYQRVVLVQQDFSQSLTSVEFAANINRRTVLKRKKGKPQYAYLQAFLDCPSATQSGYSRIIRLRPDLINSGQAVSFRDFANALKTLLN